MRYWRFSLAFILALVIAQSSLGQSMGTIADVTRFGEINLRAVDSLGNLFTTYMPSPTSATWRLEGNIPLISGRAATAPFVAITERFRPTNGSPNPTLHCVVTSNGDPYAEDAGGGWEFYANIPTAAGRAASGSFAGLSAGPGIVAVTDLGERYRSDPGDQHVWEYIDSIPEQVGAVPATKSALGSLKSAFR